MPIRTTMGDIAKACKVGKTTVSRALNGRPYVDPDVAAKIIAKAEELGYRPDPALQVLAQHRWNRPAAPGIILAVVSVNSSRGNPAEAYIKSIRKRAEELGYNIEQFIVNAGGSVKKMGQVLYNRGIRGVIIPPVIDPVEWDWNWANFSPVGCGIGEFRLPIHSVDINHFSAIRQCWRQCVNRGYRRIGAALFTQPGPDNNDSLRHAAIYYEQVKSGMDKVPIFTGTFKDYEKFIAWYEEYTPDVVIGLNSTVFWWLKKSGHAIPEKLGVCLSLCETPHCAGVLHQPDRIAECAVNWVDQLLRINEHGLPTFADEILIEAGWRDGTTLRPCVPTTKTEACI